MERFTGTLSTYRLKLLIPALGEGSGSSGLLTVERGACRREFQISNGTLISERSNDPREHLAQLLADLRMLSAADAATAFERAERERMPLGRYLIEQKLVDEPRMLEAICHKAREAFFDCYLWESGEVRFEPGPQTAPGVPMALKLMLLHRDGMARMREWQAFRVVFPDDDVRFRIDRESAGMFAPPEDQLLLHLAEAGATLGELLGCAREGKCATARRIFRFYRQGVLSPKAPLARETRPLNAVGELLAAARDLLQHGRYEDAAAVAGRALERAPVPEAHALYRDAELKLGLAISDEVLALEGRIRCEELPFPLPDDVTADDLYLHARLRGSPSIRQAIRTAAMGELAAFRSMKRLLATRLVTVTGESVVRRRRTDPYGVPVLS